MNDRPLYIACYDISDPGRLRAALKVLRNYATGGQKSVFECFLNAAEKAALVAEVREVIDPEEDRFLLLRLESKSRVHVLGIAELPADPDYFYIG
jgi:CRISPR-associated protein Cas2